MTISQAIDSLAETFGWDALSALPEDARLALIEDATNVRDFEQYAADIGAGNLALYAQTLVTLQRRGGFSTAELDGICGEMPSWA